MTNAPLWIDEPELPVEAAIAALRDALRTPAENPPRQIVPVRNGQLLLMPAELPGAYAGVKLVTIAPDNPAVGLPRIAGVYVLFDGVTLQPVALLDAARLTAIRTAAVSALAVDALAPADASRLVIFGAGPQAYAHLDAIAAIRPIRQVHIIGRTPASANTLRERVTALGFTTDTGLRTADIVACCTTAREPLFDSAELPDEATVVAVGSHEPDARELDADLVRRATVVVESRASAATAGDIVMAGTVDEIVAGELADLVAGRVQIAEGRPRVFKSVGEAWEDLAVGAAIVRDRS